MDNRKYLKDVKESLKEAIMTLESGEVQTQSLYMLAPLFYSKRLKINNDALIKEMCKANEEQVSIDCSYEKESIKQYKFHYVSSYLYCYVIAGKFDEFKYDELMELTCNENDIFV